ncbi:hypothetical protein E4Z66_03425 [Aliishimia ponticola]|uniref:TfuA-like core domain-containing protein n=1 Tax=Aliishimia ponticola TaxID=2499833 RepID=A0A4V3XKX4_9RHOB|nr:TfuA-like protein [Aliishimia ponticola]THH38633.1 hypothetical protein E4Z66_03425 [Aliishimia ponticola]
MVTPPREVPLVFLGPSCDADSVRQILPDAVIVPPVARGDLYRYRMLNFGLFVIFDGVFSDALAVAPREIVDVMEDGAAVVGAASMGALRAADCAVAGAVGQGAVFRLFRRGVLTSEDEVAVLHVPDRAYPPVTLALVSIRFALRRAHREGHLAQTQTAALMEAAQNLTYQDRSWARIAAAAGMPLGADVLRALKAHDIKRADVLACCRFVRRHQGTARLASHVRADLRAPVGRMGQPRERGPDPFAGYDMPKVIPDFWLWALCAGALNDAPFPVPSQAQILAADTAALRQAFDDGAPQLSPLFMRFSVFRKAVDLMVARGTAPQPQFLDMAEREILASHGVSNWADLSALPDFRAALDLYRTQRAMALEVRNYRLISLVPVPEPAQTQP